MLKSKYILYVAYAVIAALLMLIPVFHGRYSILYWGAIFFYTIGPIFFVMFQNAVYNKTYFDLFDGGMFNWKGSSGNMFFIAMLGMIVPIILIVIIGAVFGADISYWFMLITGIIFTVTANNWIKWTYSRFVKRKYQNMEGFRSNA